MKIFKKKISRDLKKSVWTENKNRNMKKTKYERIYKKSINFTSSFFKKYYKKIKHMPSIKYHCKKYIQEKR